jgi:chromosome segregation ATPase
VVRGDEEAAASKGSPPATKPADVDQPEATRVDASQQRQPEDQARAAELEAAHEQDQIAIAALRQRVAELEATHEQDQTTIAALHQRGTELEEELRRANRKVGLAEFLAQVRESEMRVVLEAG